MQAESIHYVTPADDTVKQTGGMKRLGIFDEVNVEIGDIIVAGVDADRVAALLEPDHIELTRLINKE